jgi:hypothetical protein
MHPKRKENSDDVILQRVAKLLVKASDNELSLRDFRCLRILLQSNPQAREYYCDILMAMTDLKPMVFLPDKK